MGYEIKCWLERMGDIACLVVPREIAIGLRIDKGRINCHPRNPRDADCILYSVDWQNEVVEIKEQLRGNE